MKKTTCKACSRAWYLSSDLLDSLQLCPYCGATLRDKETIQVYDSLGKALYGAFQVAGDDSIGNYRLLLSIMADLAPQLQREIRIFSKALNDETMRFVIEAYADKSKLPMSMNLLKSQLVNEEGLSEVWSGTVVDAFTTAIQMSSGVGSTQLIGCDISEDQEPISFGKPGSVSSPDIFSPPFDLKAATDWDILILEDDPTPAEAATAKSDSYPVDWKIRDNAIRGRSYENDSKIIHLNVPDSVQKIGKSAFEGCNNLLTAMLPDGLTTLGESCFQDCGKLRAIRFPSTLTSMGNYCFHGCVSLDSVILPKSLKKIPDNAFHECLSLQDVRIPSGIQEIGYHAFGDCLELARIYIPASVRYIDRYAFDYCVSLKDIYYEGTRKEWTAFADAFAGIPQLNVHFSYAGSQT